MCNRLKNAVVILSFFIGYSTAINAQDWKTSYEQANKLYQSGNYSESLTSAEDLLNKNQIPDLRSKAYLLQLITSNCIALNNSDEGLKYSNEEATLFRKEEGEKSTSLAEALKKQILFLQQKGREKEALEECGATAKCFEQSYGINALPSILFSSLHGELALAVGDSILAETKWNDCLSKLPLFPDAREEYKTLLYNTAALQENLQKVASAKEKYLLLINWLEQTKQTKDESYNDAKAAIFRLQNKTNEKNPAQLITLESQLKSAVSFQQNHKNEQALELYKKAQADAVEKNVKNKTSFSIYLNYTRLLIETGKLVEAAQSLELAKPLSKLLFDPISFENLLVELTDADLTLKLGDFKNAVQKYKNLSSILSKNREQALIPYLINSANELLNLNMPKASSNILKPMVCCVDQNGKKDGRFVPLALTYSDALLAMNQPDSVLLFLDQQVFANNNQVEFKKIDALNFLGEYSTALAKLKKMEAAEASDQLKADVAYQIARTAQKTGDYVEAENYYQRAYDIYVKSDQEASWQVANSQATLYSRLGNYDKSEEILNGLLKTIPQTELLYSTAQQNLAANYVETNQLEKARTIQEKIVGYEKEKSGEGHPNYALAISNLAVLYQKEGRLNEAASLFQQALQISKSNFGNLSTDYALKELNLGIANKDLGDYAQSVALLEHAQKILSGRIGNAHPDFVLCEYNLSIAYKRMGKVDQAIPLMVHVAEFYKRQVLELFPAMSEHEQIAFYNKINRPIQDFQQFAVEIGSRKAELISSLFDFRLVTKALLLNSSTKIRKGILSGSNQQLKDEFLLWQNLKMQLGKLYSTGVTDEKLVAQLETQADNLERKISTGSATFKNSKDEREVSWKKIQSALQPGEAAIELVRLRAISKSDSLSYAALVLRKDDENPKLVVFSNGKTMEGREFSYYRNNIIHQQINNRSYRVFWQPLESLLADIQTIYLSADGIYNKINLSTIYDPDKREYLGSRFEFILLSNLREITLNNTPFSQPSKSAALFGFSDFGDRKVNSQKGQNVLRSSASSLQSILSDEIPLLPGTKVEVEQVDKIIKEAMWASNLHIGAQASETNLKMLQSPTLVHVATHGFFVEPANEEEQVILSENKKSENNPLLRAGLILSDVANPNGSEDGLLTAYEVKNLNFDNTDLVVLSACETGSGDIKNGEGVYGLQRSFLLSGANNILMSLWKVDDQATQELMVLFYRKFLAHENKADALRYAQSELIKKYPDPYFWGSFVLIGKPK